jgi:hypothetical protein
MFGKHHRGALLALGLWACCGTGRAEEPKRPVAVGFDLLPTKHMVVEVKVNDKGPYRVIFDTGAPVMLLNNKVAKESGLTTEAIKPSLLNPFGSVGQVSIKSFELGGLKAENVATIVMDHPTLELISKYLGRVEGIVGFPFFARYAMTIDYQAKQLTFVPNGYEPPDALKAIMASMTTLLEAKPKPKVLSAAGQWGLVLDRGDANEAGVTIREVLSGGAAEQAGLKPGDRLLTLDGRWTDSVADAYAAAGYVRPGSEARVRVKRNERELELTVTPRAGF